MDLFNLLDIFLYASWFTCFDCKFIPRLCNSVADELAHWGSSGENQIWIEDPPMEILSNLRKGILIKLVNMFDE